MPMEVRSRTSAGFDQLQHLGAKATGTALEIQGLENRLGGGGDVTGFGALTGLFMQAGGLVEQVASVGAVVGRGMGTARGDDVAPRCRGNGERDRWVDPGCCHGEPANQAGRLDGRGETR